MLWRWLRAIRWMITSVSLVDWNSEPAFTSRWRSCIALVRLPLWPTASPPNAKSANSGCTLRSMLAPVVE